MLPPLLILVFLLGVTAEIVPKTLWRSKISLPIKVDVHGVKRQPNSDSFLLYGITSGEEGFYYRRNESENYSIINGTAIYYRNDNAMVIQSLNSRGEFDWGVSLFGASYYNFWYAPVRNMWTVLDDGLILTGYFFRSVDIRDKYGRASIIKKKTSSIYEQFVAKISFDGVFLWGTSLTGSLNLKFNPALHLAGDGLLSAVSFGIPAQTFQTVGFQLNSASGQLVATKSYLIPIYSYVPNIIRIMPVQNGPENTLSILQIVLASGKMHNVIVPHDFSWLLVLETTCNVAVINSFESEEMFLSVTAGFLHPKTKNSCTFERFETVTNSTSTSTKVEIPLPPKATIRSTFVGIKLNGDFGEPVLAYRGSDNPFIKDFSCSKTSCNVITFMFVASAFVNIQGKPLHETLKASSLVQLNIGRDRKSEKVDVTKYWSRLDGGNCTSSWVMESFQVEQNWFCVEKQYVYYSEMAEKPVPNDENLRKTLIIAGITGGVAVLLVILLGVFLYLKRRKNLKTQVQLQSPINDREPLVTNTEIQ